MKTSFCLSNGEKYGNFSYAGLDKTMVNPGSAKKLPFKCACGRIRLIRIVNITNGQKTCGHCNDVTLKKNDRYGDLTYVDDDMETSVGSHKLAKFTCECGNAKIVAVRLVLGGLVKSCGECSKITLKSGDTYHGFKYLGPSVSVHANSQKKMMFQCTCGKTSHRSLRTVTAGLAKTCGRCNEITLENGQKYFSFTYVGRRVSVTPGSKRKLPFRCRCGIVKDIQIGSITRRDSTRCGSCHTPAELWYENNREEIRNIKCPASPSDFPEGGVVPLETVKGAAIPFDAICPACLKAYRPYLHSIKRGTSLTCGCTNNVISRWNREVADFLSSLGEKAECEFVIDGMSYDVAVPEKNLLIELHGLRWHSKAEARSRDARKFFAAKNRGYHVMVVFEDEWRDKRDIVKTILSSRLGHFNVTGVRPNKCDIGTISAKDAFAFYEKFHYIGGTPSFTHFGVSYVGKLIGCASFRKPVRQGCDGEYELSRMASDPSYRVHGIWSKVMKEFVKAIGPASVITFSDDRLFTGNVYLKMGFKVDGKVRPAYYWVKNGKRFNKSALRKPRGHTGTESDLRTSEGYLKIWDYGKTRWKWQQSTWKIS